MSQTTLRVSADTSARLKALGRKSQDEAINALLDTVEIGVLDDATIAELEKSYGVSIPDADAFVKSFIINKREEQIATLKESRPLYDRAVNEKGLSHEKAFALAQLHDHTRNKCRYDAGKEKYTVHDTHSHLTKAIQILNERLTNAEMHLHAQKEQQDG